ncbi:MAG: DoxX family protein [Chloroflexi bacterium]|nr:DoxX family protein [Chloroflexota bacterium]
MRSLGLLILRLVVGGLMAGHGSQKLFGWFGGYGIKGTSGWLETLGLKPGKPWAYLAGGSEFGGGMLLLLGFLTPLGSFSVIGAMGMAWAKAHKGKPIWVTSGGAELPLINIAAGTALALTGPGKYSLDKVLGIKLPRWMVFTGLIGTGAAIFFSEQIHSRLQTAEETTTRPEESAAELQAGKEAAHEV